MRKCKFGRCTVNCKNTSMCSQIKQFVGCGCSLAITESEYIKLTKEKNSK